MGEWFGQWALFIPYPVTVSYHGFVDGVTCDIGGRTSMVRHTSGVDWQLPPSGSLPASNFEPCVVGADVTALYLSLRLDGPCGVSDGSTKII